ncbi:hypothetical protein ACSS6W_007700 [Trichoderma asperelloides]
MANYEEISRRAEADLNTYQSKTGNARPQGLDDAGVNSYAEKKFDSAEVTYGDDLSTNRGYNKRIPPSEGGDLDARGRQATGNLYEGQGGPDDKIAESYRQQGGQNDIDIVDARVPETGGLGSANDIATQGKIASKANVGRNPPGAGGSQFKGSEMSSRSPSASGLLPVPGSPSSSWAIYGSRLRSLVKHPNMRVVVAFWLLGLINNVLYVIILSAAQDLVGSLPKGVVLLADVVPSFFTKLIAPYFIHRVPYPIRVLIFIALSAGGMLMIALTPPSKSVPVKMVGVVLASLSSGGGELSFLGLSHYYGHASLAGWGSGTGAAGLVGAGLYVLLTDWWGFTVQQSLLFSACLPAIMFISFFFVLPLEPLRQGSTLKEYDAIPGGEVEDEVDGEQREQELAASTSALLAPEPSVLSVNTTYAMNKGDGKSLKNNLRRAKSLVIPYMAPLFMVYVAEYTINQGVSPTLLFPLESSPFNEYREFYPFYGFLYQLGVFISRSSTAFVRIHHLYVPSLLQVGNLILLTLHAMFFFIPSVYIVFIIIFWEGLLGGAVYVNCFAEIMEKVPAEEREFSLSATTVSDSGGICIAGLISILMETSLCEYQVSHGRDWCQRIGPAHN